MTDVWLTDPAVLAAVGGWESFDLDPCGSDDPPWPTARQAYTWRDNGLMQPWFGRVWLNPPYSRVAPWMGRMAAHGRGLAFIFAKTGTATFQELVFPVAAGVFWLAGRQRFCLPDGRPGPERAMHPSVLIAYGAEDADRLAWLGHDRLLEGCFQPLNLPRIFAAALATLEPESSWAAALERWLSERDGPVPLAEVYRAFADHPKTRRNRHWQAKLRQTLQRRARRVGPGVWASREAAA